MGKVLENLIRVSAEVIARRDLGGNEDFLQIGRTELPPYGRAPIGQNTLGRLAETKEWFVTTPTAALISEGKASSSLKAEAPDFDVIVQNVNGGQKTANNVSFLSTNHSHHSL